MSSCISRVGVGGGGGGDLVTQRGETGERHGLEDHSFLPKPPLLSYPPPFITFWQF